MARFRRAADAHILCVVRRWGILALSPNGRSLAYVVREALWVTDLESGKHRQITLGNQRVSAPRWSPDSTQLAYYTERDGRLELRALNMASDQTIVFKGVVVFTINIAQPPQWSPDGKQLFFMAVAQPTRDPPKAAKEAPLGIPDQASQNRPQFGMGGADFIQWHGNYPMLKHLVEIRTMADEGYSSS
jgi:Tol biopolymer transport system component